MVSGPARLGYVAAYVDIFLIFDWERVWEWTFMDVTLFTWEHDPPPKKPILGTMAGSTLSLNAGSGVGSIDSQESVTTTAMTTGAAAPTTAARLHPHR